jgi:hypothetical protein
MKTCPKILVLLELNRMMSQSQLIFDKSVYFFKEQKNTRITLTHKLKSIKILFNNCRILCLQRVYTLLKDNPNRSTLV